MKENTVNYSAVAKESAPISTISIRLTGKRWFHFRISLGLMFVKIGAWLAFSEVEIEDKNEA